MHEVRSVMEHLAIEKAKNFIKRRCRLNAMLVSHPLILKRGAMTDLNIALRTLLLLDTTSIHSKYTKHDRSHSLSCSTSNRFTCPPSTALSSLF